MKKRRNAQEGQAMVEFALSLLLMVGFVFAFMQVCLLLAYGNFAHYATFMAARAYLSSGGNQKQRANDVLQKTLSKSLGNTSPRWPGLMYRGENGRAEIGQGPNFDASNTSQSWVQGVRYTFKGKLFSLPFSKPKANGGNYVELISESWLGREPTDSECRARVSELKGEVLDNGC